MEPVMLLTMTTALDRKDRLHMFYDLMESFKQYEPILLDPKHCRFIIVNEFPVQPSFDATSVKTEILRIYPSVEYVQKEEIDKGQARSLNILFSFLKPYKNQNALWIHWEDSWYIERPFLKHAVELQSSMETKSSQLQLTYDWLDMPRELLVEDAKHGVVHVKSAQIALDAIKNNLTFGDSIKLYNFQVGYWPLYSLRPSVNDLDFYLNTPGLADGFDESPEKWPVAFEWDFAKEWVHAGGKKGVMVPSVAVRHGLHTHTYS
jgi:hypothetical protein